MRNQRFHTAIVAGLTLLALGYPGSASAEPKGTPSPARSASKRSCAADAKKLCAGIDRGGGRIDKCLREHAAQLSEPCKEKLIKHSEQNAGQRPCAADAAKFCKGVASGEGRIFECLDRHTAELSPACKKIRVAAQQKRAATPAPTHAPAPKES